MPGIVRRIGGGGRRRARGAAMPGARGQGGSEQDHQRALFQWIGHAKTARGLEALALAFHVPNGGARSRVEAAILIGLGVRAGVLDVCLPVPRRGFVGCWIELKSERGRLTLAQRWWIERLRNVGHVVAVCRSWWAARAVLEWYLGATEDEPAEIQAAA